MMIRGDVAQTTFAFPFLFMHDLKINMLIDLKSTVMCTQYEAYDDFSYEKLISFMQFTSNHCFSN